MKRKPTIKDIAKHVGVSISTVSRVLNNNTTKVLITEKTKNKIFDAVKEFEYSPNINAQRLVQNKSYIIGLEVPALHLDKNAFADHTLIEAMSGIESVLHKSKYKLLILFKNKEYMQTEEYLKLFNQKMIDGLLVWGANFNNNYKYDLFKYPVVFTNTMPNINSKFNYVGHKNKEASFSITEYMIKKGYKKFIYLGGTRTDSISIEREEGFRLALENNNIKIPQSRIFKIEYKKSCGSEVMEMLLSKNIDFDAIVTASDTTALGVYETAKKYGKKIPEDFGLCGGDGVDAFGENYFPITTFKVDCFRMGSTAIKELIKIIETKQNTFFRKTLKTKFIQRSTA